MTSIGRYKIEGPLASGGMADVHLARLDGPGGFSKKYVIKTMLRELRDDPHFVEMFLTEARLAAMLAHPNVVEVIDFGKDRDRFYIAMEFVEGATLRLLADVARKEHQPLPAAVVAHVGAGACAGAAYVHELRDADGRPVGLLHRDISPDNIIVSRDGVPKLLDFGVAKATNAPGPRTTAGALKGKLAYMSPEQVRGDRLDPRTDVYSLGVTLYELLAGRRPIIADNELELALRVLERAPPPLGQLAPHAPPTLVAIVERAMHRDAGQRYGTARELQESLERFVAPEREEAHTQLCERVRRAAAHRTAAVTVRDVATPGEQPPSQVTRALTSPARRASRRRTRVIAAAAAVALLGAAVGTAWHRRAAVSATPAKPEPASTVLAAPTPRSTEPPTPTPPQNQPDSAPEPKLADPPRATESRARTTKVPGATRAAVRDGTLTLRSNPWCDVRVDGEPVGSTPLLDLKLPAGRHHVLLTNAKLGARRQLVIDVPAGRGVERAVIFRLGSVRVDAPPGTRIFRGSVLLATAPAPPLELVSGVHTLGFILPPSQSLVARKVSVNPHQTVDVRVP